jgi:outer membrane receptor protein involved in Fe transport
VLNKKTFLAIEPQIVGPQLSDTRGRSNTSFVTNVVLTSKEVLKGMDLQVGVYNLFGQYARLPHTSQFDQSQPWLRYPGTTVLFSVTYRF